MLDFMNNIVDRLDIGQSQTLVGVVRFSNFADLQFPLGMYQTKTELKQKISATGYVGGSTNTYDGLRLANEVCFNSNNGDRSYAPNVAILITDGIPTQPQSEVEGRRRAIDESGRLRQKATVFSIGITTSVDEGFLQVMSSPPSLRNQNYFATPDFNSLQPILNSLVSQACAQTTPAQTIPVNPGKCHDVCHNLSICLCQLFCLSFVCSVCHVWCVRLHDKKQVCMMEKSACSKL